MDAVPTEVARVSAPALDLHTLGHHLIITQSVSGGEAQHSALLQTLPVHTPGSLTSLCSTISGSEHRDLGMFKF